MDVLCRWTIESVEKRGTCKRLEKKVILRPCTQCKQIRNCVIRCLGVNARGVKF